jgi:hypothetical protein
MREGLVVTDAPRPSESPLATTRLMLSSRGRHVQPMLSLVVMVLVVSGMWGSTPRGRSSWLSPCAAHHHTPAFPLIECSTTLKQ